MEKTIYLKLYGQIKHEDDLGRIAWQLYQSKAMTRLRDVSLSSVPSRFTPDSMAASRFEHSVGVGHLARMLAQTRVELADDEAELLTAALLHDVGSPPFSHISEIFFWDLSGKTHEEETSSLLQPGSELEKILRKDGIDARRIVGIINGKDKKLGPLISGSIDLDNIDNSLHLLLSLGYNSQAPYQPEELLRAFRVHNEEITLDSKYLKEIIGWQECRVLLYDALHKDPSLSAASMLYRALEYAYRGDYLDRAFFRLSESDALHFLLKESSGKSEKILKRVLRWKHYPLAYQTLTDREDPRLASLYSNWQGKKAVADRMAKELGVDPEDVTFYVGRDRGEKEIHLPFSGKNSEEVARLFRGQKGKQRLAVFLKKEHQNKRNRRKVGRIIEEIKEELPEEKSEHIFF